ncbi:cation-transporting ATPase [Beggiatoa sp. PS]|nr:cation-transporting ATPase [Beggiatoa sp. PS]
MLLEFGFVVGAYVGVRLSEYYIGKEKIKTLSVQTQTSKKCPEIPAKKKVIKNSSSKNLARQVERNYDRYLKTSFLNLGVSSIRQFIFPPIAPLYLVFFIHNSFPVYKIAEKQLTEEKKVQIEMLLVSASLLGLATSQYFAVALGNFFYHFASKIIDKTKERSKKMLKGIFEQLPRTAWVLRDKVEIEIPLEHVHINDIVVVTIGEVVPIDGVIQKGMAMIDQHALTGESQPAEKGLGEKVLASTLVISGKIWVTVEHTGEGTIVAQIDHILDHSAQFHTNLQLRGDKWSDEAILPFFGLSCLAFFLMGPNACLVVLGSHFGNRLRVLAPLGTLNYLEVAVQKGILVKDGRALEGLNKVDTILFDKTGTLTKETLEVGNIILCDDYGEDELLIYAATAEQKLTHPIAKAILNKAKASQLNLPLIDDAQYQIGYGVTVSFKNQVIQVGSIRFMEIEGIPLPAQIETAMTHSHEQGHSLVIVAVNRQVIGGIEVQAVVRPEVKQLISGLRQRGIKHLAIVSGDHKKPTQNLANALGIDEYFYDILPQEKANIVEQLQKQGQSVCFVGDGINDTIAMKKADVSISLTGASSIATDVADVILMEGTLHHINDLFDISQDLSLNLKTSFATLLIPTAINLGGAFVFNLGFTLSLIIKDTMFLAGVGNAMFPLTKLEKKSRLQEIKP